MIRLIYSGTGGRCMLTWFGKTCKPYFACAEESYRIHNPIVGIAGSVILQHAEFFSLATMIIFD